MNPKQALEILDQATQPGVRLTRMDCVNIQISLEALIKFVNDNTEKTKDEPTAAKDEPAVAVENAPTV